MTGLFRNNPETREGKYPVVLRRDGTVPEWEWFILGARDPLAAVAIRAYADAAEAEGWDPQYVADLREMAEKWLKGLVGNALNRGDPDAPPHRKDDPDTLNFPQSLAEYNLGLRGRNGGRSA